MKTKTKHQKRSIKLNILPQIETTKTSFINHLLELRTRLLWLFLTLIIGSSIGYLLYPQILSLLLRPYNGILFYNSPAGGLDFIVKISFFFGILFSLPFFIYHLIRFIQPALPPKSIFFIIKYFFSSIILMIIGMSFAYFISLPAALNFLSQFGTDQVQSLITTDAYFSFVTRYIVGFGFLFELPLILMLINSFKQLKISTLFSYQKYVILGSFIIAAIITPTPDFFNQTIMALPLIALYQISILIIYLTNIKKLF